MDRNFLATGRRWDNITKIDGKCSINGDKTETKILAIYGSDADDKNMASFDMDKNYV